MIGKTNAISGVSDPVPKIKTVSGSVISISDALAMPAVSLVADIDAVQSGSGDPSPSNIRPISGWSNVNVYREAQYDAGATPYATINLNGTVYGGSLDVTTGVLTVEYVKQSITAFTNIWSGSYQNGTPVYVTITGSTHTPDQINPVMMKSNMFTYTELGRTTAPLYSYGSNSGAASTQTFVLPSSITTLAEANAWLSSLSEPLECTFKLATPQTIQLTPTEVQMLLGNNTIWSDSGDTELQYWARR